MAVASSSSSPSLSDHFSTTPAALVCRLCWEPEFTYKYSFQRHLETAHPHEFGAFLRREASPDTPFWCDHPGCFRSYHDQTAASRHRLSHVDMQQNTPPPSPPRPDSESESSIDNSGPSTPEYDPSMDDQASSPSGDDEGDNTTHRRRDDDSDDIRLQGKLDNEDGSQSSDGMQERVGPSSSQLQTSLFGVGPPASTASASGDGYLAPVDLLNTHHSRLRQYLHSRQQTQTQTQTISSAAPASPAAAAAATATCFARPWTAELTAAMEIIFGHSSSS